MFQRARPHEAISRALSVVISRLVIQAQLNVFSFGVPGRVTSQNSSRLTSMSLCASLIGNALAKRTPRIVPFSSICSNSTTPASASFRRASKCLKSVVIAVGLATMMKSMPCSSSRLTCGPFAESPSSLMMKRLESLGYCRCREGISRAAAFASQQSLASPSLLMIGSKSIGSTVL